MKRKNKTIKRVTKKTKVSKTNNFTPQRFLVYDYDCDFCSTLAGMCAYHFDIKIVSNQDATKFYPFLDKEKIDRDVHYVVIVSKSIMIYTGAEAINRILGCKIPFLIGFYNHPFYKFLFNCCYNIVKKVRKFL